MTIDKEQIERLAREASVWPAMETAREPGEQHLVDALNQQLLDRWIRFAAAIAEECAKVAEARAVRGDDASCCDDEALCCAAAIRAKFGSTT
jgi:hypothetical protein